MSQCTEEITESKHLQQEQYQMMQTNQDKGIHEKPLKA